MTLGIIQEKLGQNDAALASFEQAATVNPRNPDAFLNQALLLEVLNRKKEAIDMYNKVVAIMPDNALALNNLAMIAAESGGNLDQAQTYAERARKGAPNSPDVADTLGYVYLQKNLNAQAAEIFRQNVEHYPQNPSFHFHLAMALLKTGDKQGAKEQAGKALQGAPPNLQSQIKTFIGQIG
jgi:tetratricopeptide (TPR) repeat protein